MKSKLTFTGYQAAVSKAELYKMPYSPYFRLAAHVGEFNELVADVLEENVDEVAEDIIRQSMIDRLGFVLSDLANICEILGVDMAKVAEDNLTNIFGERN